MRCRNGPRGQGEDAVNDPYPQKTVLNGQQQHWEKKYAENVDMFGTGPSYTARKAVECFKEKGPRRIFEPGSDQGARLASEWA
jgi:hypothetical protein